MHFFYTLVSRVISLLRVCNSYWRFFSDPRGLEIRGDGGGPSPALAFLPGHHHRHRRHPHGRSPHLRVCRSGPHHRHLPGKVKKRQPMPKFSTSEFRKVFNGDDGFSRLTIWSKTQWSGFWQPLGGRLLEKKTLGFGRFSRSQLDAVGAVLPATPCSGMRGRIV